jgi:hypothetical protein
MVQLKEIQERLKSPIHKNAIAKAVKHEQRLVFHTEPEILPNRTTAEANRFLQWVKGMLPYEKYVLFLQLFKCPGETVPLTDEIFEVLHKIFEGRDRVIIREFIDSETELEGSLYLDHIGLPSFWENEAFEALKFAINSIMVVDMAVEENEDRFPDPYAYLLDISRVLDLEPKGRTLDWVMFTQGDDLVVIDDESYRVFVFKDNQIKSLRSENKHSLGYCPATWFWEDAINSQFPIVKKSPLTKHLTQLDWLYFYKTGKKHLDTYAPYPIYWGFTLDCDFKDEERGTYCESGFLKDDRDQYILRGGSAESCPVCSVSKLKGAGSYFEVPAPIDDEPSLREPVGIISIDKPSLDYNVEEVERLKMEIYTGVTGNAIDVISDMSVNEKQVMSLFESRKDVLLKLKVGFENIQTWTESTIFRLRYGERFISTYINYGTDFFLFSEEVSLKMYQEALEKKLSQSILDILQDQYFETKYRNNPDKMDRIKTLNAVEPYRHLSLSEVVDLNDSERASNEDTQIKASFSSLIQRFERENGNIADFGAGVSFEAKVSQIEKALRFYVSDQMKKVS